MIIPFLVAVLTAVIAYVRLQGSGSESEFSVAQIEALRDYVANEFAVSQPIKLRFKDTGFRFPDLANATQLQIDHQLKIRGVPYRYPIVDELPKDIPRFDPDATVTTTTYPMVVTDEAGNTSSFELESDATSTPVTPPPEFSLDLALSGSVSVWLDSFKYRAMMSYDLDTVHANDLPFYMAQSILEYLLEIDLKKYTERKTIKFEDYIPSLTVNVIAAEDSLKHRSKEVDTALKESVQRHLDAIRPFVNVTANFLATDVTKSKISAKLLSNSTESLTFIYSTTLMGFLNSIDGAHVYHLTQEAPVPLEGDMFGTQYLEALEKNGAPRVNVTNFLSSVFKAIEKRVGLIENCTNKHLEVYFTAKAYTIRGIELILDHIKENPGSFDRIYQEVFMLIDTIIREERHDWSANLKKTYSLYKKIIESK